MDLIGYLPPANNNEKAPDWFGGPHISPG